ncbi:hypothetical protein [Methanofollis fontis]|uniref:Uncharacterized protein n=1 Tax=Methanofollis fontis TaxID=2052832 RepID=A0A483CQ20_9EURY|nr:hypothetical protein [Methanofollis fontis]TAJ44188.1 hypothetical protein CUJ86_09190 [Methanofollis fontis]
MITGYRGHEFPYFSLYPAPDARFGLNLRMGKGIADGKDGLCEYAVLGDSHACFSPAAADAIVAVAERCRQGR